MKRFLLSTVACVGLVAGSSAATAETWQLQSTYPGSITKLGTIGKWIAERVTVVTDGEITLEFQ